MRVDMVWVNPKAGRPVKSPGRPVDNPFIPSPFIDILPETCGMRSV